MDEQHGHAGFNDKELNLMFKLMLKNVQENIFLEYFALEGTKEIPYVTSAST